MSNIDTQFHQNSINKKTEILRDGEQQASQNHSGIPDYEQITDWLKRTWKNKLYFCVNIGSGDLASRFFLLEFNSYHYLAGKSRQGQCVHGHFSWLHFDLTTASSPLVANFQTKLSQRP